MKRWLESVLLSVALSAPTAGWAQSERGDLGAVPDPPPLPERVRSGETLEPEVTIRRREDRVITEYRVNGVVRAIKVEPDSAPAYFLVDADGDGKLERRMKRLQPDFLIPQWVLFSW